MIKTIASVPKIIFKRLPYIAVYIVTLYAFLYIGELAWYRYQPANHFMNYTKFDVNNAEEGNDVPFQACKDIDQPYKVTGDRIIYRIPEGSQPQDRVFAGNYKIDSTVTADRCVNGFIFQEQFNHEPGNYIAYTSFDFEVKHGFRKRVTFESNVYTIFPVRVGSVEEIEKRIFELEKEIELLKLQLQQARMEQSTNTGQPTTDTPARTDAGITPMQSNPQTAASPPPPAPTPAPTPSPTPPPERSVIPIFDEPAIGCIGIICI